MEGCLSVPDISGEVLRPQKVRIKAQDENGNYFDNPDSAMLCFLKRKGIKLDIEIDFSEEDIEDLKSGESFNWTFPEIKYASLEIDVKNFNSSLWKLYKFL